MIIEPGNLCQKRYIMNIIKKITFAMANEAYQNINVIKMQLQNLFERPRFNFNIFYFIFHSYQIPRMQLHQNFILNEYKLYLSVIKEIYDRNM